jgi:hypothetical protein
MEKPAFGPSLCYSPELAAVSFLKDEIESEIDAVTSHASVLFLLVSRFWAY